MKKVFFCFLTFCFTVSFVPIYAQTVSPGFANPTIVSHGDADSQMPKMVISDNGIFVVWIETALGRSDIFIAKSTDGGQTFDNQINLSSVTHGQSGYPALVQSGNNVYVVWESALAGNSTIFFAKSTDSGNSFSKPIMISDGYGNSAFPQIAVSGNLVYVTWVAKSESTDTNVVITKSDNQGDSFSNPVSITGNGGITGLPKIMASDNNVYLIWENNSTGNYDVFLSKSNDYANSFDAPTNISNDAGQSGTPQMTISKNNIYAVWMDSTPGNYDIFFAKSTDGGKSFNKPISVANTALDSGYPQFAVAGNNVFVVWTETISDKNYDVFFAKSTDGGQTFDKPLNLSNNSGQSGWAQIAADDTIYVSWVDNTPGNFDVLITKSSNGGLTFENPINVSNTGGESYYNSMIVSGDVVYMSWQEGQQGKHAIVFSKSTTFVPEFGPFVSIALVFSLGVIISLSTKSNLKF